MLNAQTLEGPAPRRKLTASPRLPRIVALCGQKGGVGKSTIAVCLAAEALERGRRVLLVDADPQGTARMWGDAALGAGKPAPTIVAMGATMVNPGQLDALIDSFEVVLLDCPGRHDATQRAALMLCDLAILPCGPSSADAWALASSMELVSTARQLRPDLRAVIAITKKRPRTVLGRSAREDLAASGLPVLQSELCDRLAFQECVGFGLGVTTYAPKDPAAVEVRALYDEIFGNRKETSHGD